MLSLVFLVLVFLLVLRVVEDYIVYPRLIGQGIHLHPLAVIIAILAGAELAGVAGIFLAIPVVAILTVSYRHWLEHRGSEGLADLLEPTPVESVAINDPVLAARIEIAKLLIPTWTQRRKRWPASDPISRQVN